MERRLHYNQLPSHLRERLNECFDGNGAPKPIFEEKMSVTGAIIGWLILSFCGLGGLMFCFAVDFGKSYSGIQSPFWLIGYGIALFCFFYGIFKSIQRFMMKRNYPFTPGRFIFPLDFVDATKPVLRIIPMADMVDFRCVHHHTNGAYTHTEMNFYFEGGGHEMFTVRGKMLAEQLLDQFDNQRALFRQALEEGDMGIVAALDPFIEIRLDETWGDFTEEEVEVQEGPEARGLIMPLLYPSIVALIFGFGIASPIWGARQWLSDGARFKYASTTTYDPPGALERYLRNGGFRYAKEVKEDLLPKARYNEAKKKNTVIALRGFIADYPKSKYVPEAKKEVKALFNKSLTKFKAQAAKDNPKAIDFMEKLLRYMESENSPPMEVRFRPPPYKHLELNDKEMSKQYGPNADPKKARSNPLLRRTMAPIAPHFTSTKSIPREKAITNILQNGFKAVFPEDILKLDHGPRLQDSDIKKDKDGKLNVKNMKFPRPTIVVDYVALPSGMVYTLRKDPNRVFTGIKVYFAVTLHIPDEAEPLTMNINVEPPKNFKISYTNSLGLSGASAGPSTGTVYNSMAIRAFDQLANKMRDFFFDKSSAAYKKFKATPKKPSYKSRYESKYN